jgi:hypothetical protein
VQQGMLLGDGALDGGAAGLEAGLFGVSAT